MKNLSASLDDLRAQYPHLGFAAYALTPGGIVTFEIHTPDHVFPYEGPTLGAAIAAAFPPEENVALPPPAAPPEPINVFD